MKGAQSRTGHVVASALLASGVMAGCGSSKPAAQTQATVPTTTVSATASYAVPNQITVAYAQRVVNALDAIDGDATRLILASRALVPSAVYRLEAIDADSWFTEEISTWQDELSSGLRGYRKNPGNVRDVVQKVIFGSPSCVWIKALSDFNAVSVTPAKPSLNYIQLVPRIAGRDKGGWNMTPWMIALEGYNSHGLTPGDPCASS